MNELKNTKEKNDFLKLYQKIQENNEKALESALMM